MSSQFIGREDWEGENGNSIATEDDDNNYDANAEAEAEAEAGEYACNFLRSRYADFERGMLGGRHQR
jgi:hypothetical protein